MYLVAYVGSSRVRDLPENLVAPDNVRNMNANIKINIVKPNANFVKDANYSSGKFLRIQSMTTYAFIIQ